ncbi:uncharacterized protein LOC135497119 [Lineus longissimus]|uniref:uncharacterized protein LOC135497119 n=1 Tax=Lineus longissimus TaxID=88925 RepID=UPI002B4F8E58
MSTLRLYIVVTLLLLTIALGLGSFFTQAWIKYTVRANASDPEYKANVGSSYLYHTRERGLFWNKLDLTTATAPVIRANGGSPYFTITYNLKKQCDKPSGNFKSITDMMKSNACLHIAYLICLLLGCWMVTMSAALNNCKPTMVVAVVLLILGEFAGIASLALFHLYTVAEVSAEIPELDGFIKKSWTKFLINATSTSYSYSYGSQVASLIATLVVIIICMVFLAKWPKKEKKEETNKQQDQRWLGSEQGTVIFGGAIDNRQGDVRRNEPDLGQQHRNRRHSWSGYWEDPGDKNGRFKTSPAPGFSGSVPALDRDPLYQRGANKPYNKNFYTNNPLYPMRY